jgi:hypothetical protein
MMNLAKEPVTNGRFVTWVAALSVLISMVAGLMLWVRNLTEALDSTQTKQIEANTNTLAARGERIAIIEGRVTSLEAQMAECKALRK